MAAWNVSAGATYPPPSDGGRGSEVLTLNSGVGCRSFASFLLGAFAGGLLCWLTALAYIRSRSLRVCVATPDGNIVRPAEQGLV
jgi:hypothetical protein